MTGVLICIVCGAQVYFVLSRCFLDFSVGVGAFVIHISLYEAEFIQSLYSLCSQREGNSWHLDSRLHAGTCISMMFLSINNTEFQNYLGQMYHVELEIKARTRATLLLLT